jgi:hypothetical protein
MPSWSTSEVVEKFRGRLLLEKYAALAEVAEITGEDLAELVTDKESLGELFNIKGAFSQKKVASAIQQLLKDQLSGSDTQLRTEKPLDFEKASNRREPPNASTKQSVDLPLAKNWAAFLSHKKVTSQSSFLRNTKVFATNLINSFCYIDAYQVCR